MVFIGLVLLIYGSMNVYAMSKMGLGLPRLPGVALWGVAMTFAPLAIRALREHHWLRAERALSWLAFVWMGVLFLFCCLALTFDAAHVLMSLSGREWPLTPCTELLWTGLPALAAAAYGFFEASRIRVDRIHIATPRLAAGKVTFAQVSDMHLGAMLGRRFMDRVTAKLRALNPDAILATGDIVDGRGEALHALTEHFRELHPPLGAYAILGNHEYFVGLDNSLRFFENAHFTVLRGQAATVGGVIVAGVDDRSLGVHVQAMPEEARAALRAAQAQHYIILLKHQPLVDDDVPFDLQLSGHLHGGQIFPFGFFSKLFYGARAGRVTLARGRLLYVNRGTGTWGPPMRLFAPPEITLITIEGKGA
ncbi:MAG TPA: metallophosphoesterase [Gallionella sp.]|nr:metallophosphoesterase [Gallionella sp.]